MFLDLLQFLVHFALRGHCTIPRITRRRQVSVRGGRAPQIQILHTKRRPPIELPGCGPVGIKVALPSKPLKIYIHPLEMGTVLQDLKTETWTLNQRFAEKTRIGEKSEQLDAKELRSNLAIPSFLCFVRAFDKLAPEIAILIRLGHPPFKGLWAWAFRTPSQRHCAILWPSWLRGGGARHRCASSPEKTEERGSNGGRGVERGRARARLISSCAEVGPTPCVRG